jgi:toxin YoeB
MDLIFLESAWEDYLYWQQVDKKMTKKINALIKETFGSPFQGIGKPEPLKFNMSGCWSRRINTEHRLVYKIENDSLIIIQCRYHY